MIVFLFYLYPHLDKLWYNWTSDLRRPGSKHSTTCMKSKSGRGGEEKILTLLLFHCLHMTCQTKSDFRLLVLRVWIPCQRLLCAVCMPCTKHKACLSSLLGTLHILFVIYIKLYLKRNLIQFYVNKTRIFSLNKNASVVLYIEKKLY